MVWRYFDATGKVGGTANPSDNTFYVDSYKGSDLNVGSNVAPFQTIQKCLDASATGGCDIIAAGRFKEGDFLNRRNNVSLIADGDVYIEPGLTTEFTLTNYGGSYSVSFNIDTFDSNIVREYGKLHFKDFEYVRFGGYALTVSPLPLGGAHNCEFKDLATIAGGLSNKLVQKCVFDNTRFLFAQFNSTGTDRYCFHQNNNFINGSEWEFSYVAGSGGRLRDNYFDATSTLYQRNYTNSPHFLNWLWQNNHAEGSFVNKIRFSANGYNDLDAAQVAFPSGIFDNVPYAQSPQFKGLNADDYSYDSVSPNATGGVNGGVIGAFGIGYSSNNVDSGNWTLTNITITGVGAASVANLTAAGVGTLEETVGNQLNATEDVYIGATHFPGLIQDFSAGQTADKTKSADAGTPSIPTLEIQYSLDSTNGVDGTWSAWIEVPIGVTPLVDGSGKGNGDDTFVPGTGDKIPARWVRRRITLRDDEVVLP